MTWYHFVLLKKLEEFKKTGRIGSRAFSVSVWLGGFLASFELCLNWNSCALKNAFRRQLRFALFFFRLLLNVPSHVPKTEFIVTSYGTRALKFNDQRQCALGQP